MSYICVWCWVMSYDVWTTDRLVPPIDSTLLPCNVGYQRVRHSDYPPGMVHPGCIAVPGMGSGHKNTSCTSVPFVKVTEPVIDTTTPPITADITDPAPCTQVLRRRPPLPNFLPIQKQQIQTDADSSHEVSPPVTLQTILSTVSQSEQFQVRDRHHHGNAGLSYFPMGSLTSPVLPLVTSEIGTQIPSLRSPIELLNYAAELKRAHDDGADNVEALEEALGFLKHFSEHVCEYDMILWCINASQCMTDDDWQCMGVFFEHVCEFNMILWCIHASQYMTSDDWFDEVFFEHLCEYDMILWSTIPGRWCLFVWGFLWTYLWI